MNVWSLGPFIIPYPQFAWLPIPMLRNFFFKFDLLNNYAWIYINLSPSMLMRTTAGTTDLYAFVHWFICSLITLYEQGVFKIWEKYYLLLFIKHHIKKCLNSLLVLLEYMSKQNRKVLNKTILLLFHLKPTSTKQLSVK